MGCTQSVESTPFVERSLKKTELYPLDTLRPSYSQASRRICSPRLVSERSRKMNKWRSSSTSMFGGRHGFTSGSADRCGSKAVATAPVRLLGFQSRGKWLDATEAYENDCRGFAPQCPRIASAYVRLSGQLHNQRRMAATAFVVGFCNGLDSSSTWLDPDRICKFVDAEKFDALDLSFSCFIVHKAVTCCDGTFEPEDSGCFADSVKAFGSAQLRATIFIAALCSVTQEVLMMLKSVRRSVPEVTAPVRITKQICSRLAAGQLDPDESLRAASLCFHAAPAMDFNENGCVSLHLLRAAWLRQPCTAVQWHHIGQHLATVCLAANS